MTISEKGGSVRGRMSWQLVRAITAMLLAFGTVLALSGEPARASSGDGVRGDASFGANAAFAAPFDPPSAALGSLTPLSPATVATPGLEPVNLVVSPDGKSAYVGFERGTVVEQYSRNRGTGELTPLSPATVEAGLEPRTVAISPDGKSLYAANFDDPETAGGNSISQFSRNTETGALTQIGAPVPTAAGPHGIEVSPDGKSVYAADYGEKSISEFSRNTQTGLLTALSPATVTTGANPNGIAISADGRSVYTANRGSGSVSQFSRSTTTGVLTPMTPATVGAGENPHDVAISPDGESVYVPDAAESIKTKNLSQFARNTETGALSAMSPATVATGGEARGVAVSPDGASAYVANGTEGVASQYSRDVATGALTRLSPPNVPAGTHSYGATVSPDGSSVYVTNEKSDNISEYSRQTTPPAPSTTTEAASAVTQSSATLNASVNPNGAEVSECKFEYGTTTSYGSSAACVPAPGSGTSAVAVSASVSGLAANTTYHFRISASNAGGSSSGGDRQFTTQASAPSTTTEAASAVTQSSATLNASVNPNGAEVSECKFEYGTTTSYGSSAACVPAPGSGTSAVAVSASVSGLAANTTYHFRISASNAGGSSSGGDRQFTTQASAPSTTTEAASAVTQSSATLNASVNPNGAEVSECKFEYGTTTSYGSSAACVPAPGSGTSAVAVSASVSGLAANTTYHFRISASNAGGSSSGGDRQFTTQASAPSTTTEAASAVTQSSATLNASVNPNGAEVSECKFEYGTTTSYGSSAACVPAPGSGTSAVAVSASVSGLAANTTYHFRISASNAGGSSSGGDRQFTTQASAPSTTTEAASAVTQSSATLNASVNPNGAEVSECKFEYGTTTSYGSSAACVPAPGSGTSAVAVSASVSGLAANTTYHFRISASNAGGSSSGGDRQFTTQASAPSTTTEAASAVTQSSATLNASVNPNGAEVSECKFEYGTTTSYGSSAACVPAPGSGTSAVAVSASVSGLAANTTYHFRISASNAGGSSSGGDRQFTTQASAPSTTTEAASAVTQSSATLNASVNPNGAEVSECKFEYGTTTSYGSSAACVPAPGSGTSAVAVSASVSGLAANTTYHFRISASNAGGSSSGGDRTLSTGGSAPEFGRCEKVAKGTGQYENAACSAAGGTKSFVWRAGVLKAHFATRPAESATVTLQSVAGQKVVCKGQSIAGEITGPKTVGGVVLVFTGCERAGSKCTSAGRSEGEAVTQRLEGVLGVRTLSSEGPSHNEIGLALSPTSAVSEFRCGTTAVSVRGSVIAQITTNSMKQSLPLTFTQSKGRQSAERFVEGPRDILEASFGGGPFEQAGLGFKSAPTSEERFEINTVA